MEENKLELVEREFVLFESKIKELEKLKRILDSLNTEGFENDAAIIEEKFSNVDSILKIKRLIANLKLKIEERGMKSKLAQLIRGIFECNDNINVWGHKKLSKEYLSIYEKYDSLPKKDKMVVYAVLVKLYKKINQK